MIQTLGAIAAVCLKVVIRKVCCCCGGGEEGERERERELRKL